MVAAVTKAVTKVPSMTTYSDADKKRIVDLYNRSLEEHGIQSARAVGWSGEFSQTIRIEILCQAGDMTDRSVLDVGCGFGDLYDFLKERYQRVSYQGMDINPAMVEVARAKHPGISFFAMDFGVYEGQRFDYVLASGAFSFKVPDYQNLYFGYIKKMFELCTIAAAFNLLNRDYHIDDDTFATYSADEVRDFCSSLTKNFVLRQDYLQHDFTVYLYH